MLRNWLRTFCLSFCIPMNYCLWNMSEQLAFTFNPSRGKWNFPKKVFAKKFNDLVKSNSSHTCIYCDFLFFKKLYSSIWTANMPPFWCHATRLWIMKCTLLQPPKRKISQKQLSLNYFCRPQIENQSWIYVNLIFCFCNTHGPSFTLFSLVY